MAKRSSLLDGFAYGVLNEVLAGFNGKDGYARPSRYEVILIPPSGSRGTNSGKKYNLYENVYSQFVQSTTASVNENSKMTGLRCTQITFPGRTLDTAPDTNIYGPTRDIVQGYSYANITGTFLLSTDLREKEFFEGWQKLAFDPETWSLGYFDDYAGALDIYQLDSEDRRRNGVRLVECFPVTIGDIALDANPATTVSTIQVTFAYRYWRNESTEADLPRPLADRVRELASNTITRRILANLPKVLNRL